jgi:hypothetical protein
VRLLETQRISFLGVLQTLGAYVAAPVALLYPVGFFALFFQFVNYFFLDFYTAWYAASLVNRMVAIEQGVTILVLALVVSVVFSASVAWILLKHVKSRIPSRSEREPSLGAKLKAAFTLSHFEHKGRLCGYLLGLLLLILTFYFFYSRLVAGGRPSLFVLRGRLSTECNLEKARWHQLNLWPDSLVPAIVFAIGCLLSGWFIYRTYHRTYQDYRQRIYSRQGSYPPERHLGLGFFVRGVTEGWILWGLAIAYSGSVCASLVLAWYTPSYMPFMTYGETVEHRGEPQPTENSFLSHTEGQWYFLRRIQYDYIDDPYLWVRPDYVVVSLAGRSVTYVHVRPNAPRESRVAPLPWGLGEEPLEKDPCQSWIRSVERLRGVP